MLDCKMCNQPSEYNLEASTQHPFITILNQEKYSWRAVLIQMKQMMHHNDNEYIFTTDIIYIYCKTVYIKNFINYHYEKLKNR